MVLRLQNAPAQFPNIFLLADIFTHGLWPELDKFSDPELTELVEYLPLVALQSQAPSTALSMQGHFCHWRRWAVTKPQVNPFPAKPILPELLNSKS